ncbi:MAG: N-acetylneuraminate synthase family protein, partial [Desulfovibrio sp.]|nr:N-acetylneuraminate synthase family protein [Desulfovibrio sp.]
PEYVIGYSDHTLPGDMHILETAVLLGARVLEKHFTHDKTLPGNDHYHAMDKDDLRRFLRRLKLRLASIGEFSLRALPEEEPARANARRSLVTARDLRAGQKLTPQDLTWKRPAHGISPRDYDEVLAMRARRDLPEDTVLVWADLDKP